MKAIYSEEDDEDSVFESRNKYENKTIKKHFINCSRNKDRKPKTSSNSGKLSAFRHSESVKSKYANVRLFREHANEVKRVTTYHNREGALSLSQFDENVSMEFNNDDNSSAAISNMNGWQCNSCTFLNPEWALYCEMCNNYNPLCLSLNNVKINEYINVDDSNFTNKGSMFIETEDYEILDNSSYEEDDFNDNIQYVLLETVNNNDDNTETKNNENNENNKNNVDYFMITGHFNSYLNIKQNEDCFMIVSYQHENESNESNESNNCNENLHFKKKNKNKTSFEQYWLEMQQYNKKNKQTFHKIKKQILKNPKKDELEYILNKMITNYPLLQEDLISISSLRHQFTSTYCNVSFKLQCIIRESWIDAFYNGKGKQRSQTVFHGTNSKNDPSICSRGLIIGGTKGVPITHGSSYGHGIYCSPALTRATSYSQGSLYICLARDAKKNGDIWVVENERNILPCFLLSYRGSLSCGFNNFTLPSNAIWEFIPTFKIINTKDIHRKWRRKWFSKN